MVIKLNPKCPKCGAPGSSVNLVWENKKVVGYRCGRCWYRWDIPVDPYLKPWEPQIKEPDWKR